MAADGFPWQVVSQQVKMLEDGLDKDVAPGGVECLEIGDIVGMGLDYPASFFGMKDGHTPFLVEEAVELSEYSMHDRMLGPADGRPWEEGQTSSVAATRTCSAATCWIFSAAAAMRAPRARWLARLRMPPEP